MKFSFAIILALLSCAMAKSIDVSPNIDEEVLLEILREMCFSMRPIHDGTPAQPAPFPVSITVVVHSDGLIRPGETIRITLRSVDPNFTFMGFFMQARAIGFTTALGRFDVDSEGRTVGCVENSWTGNDAVGNSVATTPRTYQEIIWTAPESTGVDSRAIQFHLTTVERFGIYWIYQTSETFFIV